MRILVLAPHPYYVDRGTPIDLDLILRVLCDRPDTAVDLVAYADGAAREYTGLRIRRVPRTPLTRKTKPGFSLKKLASDVSMFFIAWSLVRRWQELEGLASIALCVALARRGPTSMSFCP